MLQLGCEADLTEEALGAEHRLQLRAKQLEGDESIVFEVVRQVDCGHTAAPELALDRVAIAEGCGEFRRCFAHDQLTGVSPQSA